MAALVYSAIASLDGYVEDEHGSFAWAEPDEEVHTFVNDLERTVGTYLYGRKLYETMVAWETLELERQPPHMRDFAESWRAADKVVYSRTLASVAGERTRLERQFEPAAVTELKANAERDLAVGGAQLAARALRAGLVDELRLFVVPFLAGGGKRALPDGAHGALELVDQRRFGNGTVYLRYRTRA